MSAVDVHVFSKQAEALDYLSPDNSEVSEVLYGGGARGGKTYLGCLWQILRRITMAGSVGFICREESVKLRDTTVVTFFEVLTDLRLNSVVEFNSTRLIANFSNGSVVYFRDLKLMPSDPEYDRLGSYGITDCFIDEAQQICAKAISVLKAVSRCSMGRTRTAPDGIQSPKPYTLVTLDATGYTRIS